MFILALLLVGLPVAFLIRSATDDGWRRVTSVEVLEERDVVYLPDVRIFLVAAVPPLALRAVSTHLGGPISYCLTSETFMDLAHGTHWDRSGHYLDGPAPRGMDRVRARVDDGFVEIDIATEIEGAPRGAGSPVGPSGPFCDDRSEDYLPEPSPVPQV